MKVSKRKLNKILTDSVLNRIILIGKVCNNSGSSCYLVGGTVRDIILGVPQIDVDIVTTDLTWIKKIPKKYLKKIIKSQFNTRKLIFKDCFSFDIAQSRKETYPFPTSLPKVEHGTLKEDVQRRDFTINTLFMGITSSEFGNIIDVIGGMKDIKSGLIRVLHDKSFNDDPTRIFRAIRFKERFSFRLEKKTKQLMKEAVEKKLITKLSPQRIRREIFLILNEDKWRKMLLQLNRYSILSQLGLRYEYKSHMIRNVENNLVRFQSEEINQEVVKLLGMAGHSHRKDIEKFSRRVGLRKNETRLLIDMGKKTPHLQKTLSAEGLKDTKLYWLLHSIPLEGLIYLMSISPTIVRKRIQYYLDSLREIQPSITGKDIKKLGIKEGPFYEQILRKITNEKIQGRIKSKRDEKKFLKDAIKKKDSTSFR